MIWKKCLSDEQGAETCNNLSKWCGLLRTLIFVSYQCTHTTPVHVYCIVSWMYPWHINPMVESNFLWFCSCIWCCMYMYITCRINKDYVMLCCAMSRLVMYLHIEFIGMCPLKLGDWYMENMTSYSPVSLIVLCRSGHTPNGSLWCTWVASRYVSY